MIKYKVMVVGLGKRGGNHVVHFERHRNFKVIAICDIRQEAIDRIAKELDNPYTGTDARKIAMKVRPDVFCFCTLPDIRKKMIQIGIECGAELIAFEKPIALTSIEAIEIKKILKKSKTKAVVCYQHRYGPHYKKIKEIISSGAIGNIHTIYATAVGWPAHMMEHMLHYTRWFNDNPLPEWVMANVAGRCKLQSRDKHYSPDYVGGFVQYKNGVRGIYEVGGGAPDVPNVKKWFHKNRIGAIGSEGYAEVYTGNGYKAITKNGIITGEGIMDYDQDMPGYIDDIAKWMNKGIEHPCSFSNAYINFEILQAMYHSYLEGGQIALPLQKNYDEIKELKKKIPQKKLFVTLDESTGEYEC